MKDRSFTSARWGERGFSLVELLASMVMTLMVLGMAIATYSSALSTREGENSKTDALTSAQAAINIMTREVANSGYGLNYNGIVLSDSNEQRLHIRANIVNNDYTTDDNDEDITFYYDTTSQSVLRYDPVTGTSGLINKISKVKFEYFDGGSTATTGASTPTANTAFVKIRLWVELADIQGQPRGQKVEFATKITLRNSPYMLSQY